MNTHDSIRIAEATRESLSEWASLRHALWPDTSPEEHRAEIISTLADQGNDVAFLAHLNGHGPVGFAEAALRHDYVNGCSTSPVGFLEGLYVAPPYRRRGIARRLVRAFEDWARAKGCRELASDADLANVASQAMHRALGFAETERVVYFRKPVGSEGRD